MFRCRMALVALVGVWAVWPTQAGASVPLANGSFTRTTKPWDGDSLFQRLRSGSWVPIHGLKIKAGRVEGRKLFDVMIEDCDTKMNAKEAELSLAERATDGRKVRLLAILLDKVHWESKDTQVELASFYFSLPLPD